MAETCGVSEGFVRLVKTESPSYDTTLKDTVIGRDGKQYPANIGRQSTPETNEETAETSSTRSETQRKPGHVPVFVFPNNTL